MDHASPDRATGLYRNIAQWEKFPQHRHASLHMFLDGPVPDGLHSIQIGRAPLDLVVHAKIGAPLVICLDGNAPRNADRRPPFFSGFGVLPKDIPLSHVTVSDPSLTLSDDLSLSWYAGAEGLPVQTVLPKVLQHIAAELKPSSIFFLGGSGGGFASLYYANLLAGSTALIWNPQTDITGYNPLHVRHYARDAFGIDGDLPDVLQGLRNKIDYRISYEESARMCRVIYLQNSTDGHVLSHLNPLLNRMGLPRYPAGHSGFIADDFYLYMGHWGEKHVPPPKAALSPLLSEIIRSEPDLFDGKGELMHSILDRHLRAVSE